MHQSFLPCKYPIICAPMNQVSDLTLALAVHNAGCMPSLVIPNYTSFGIAFHADKFEHDLLAIREQTGACNLLLALEIEDFYRPNLLALIIEYGVTHIELLNLYPARVISDPRAQKNLELLKSTNVVITCKLVNVTDLSKLVDYLDAVTIKGPDAASRVSTIPVALVDKIHQLSQRFPTVKIIASGGISDADDIDYYLSHGASAVSLGTVFAMSAESAISVATKTKMIASTFADTVKIGIFNQTSLQFSKVESTDPNNTSGLRAAISDPTVGHVFVGKAIDSINSIRSVADIVADLVAPIIKL